MSCRILIILTRLYRKVDQSSVLLILPHTRLHQLTCRLYRKGMICNPFCSVKLMLSLIRRMIGEILEFKARGCSTNIIIEHLYISGIYGENMWNICETHIYVKYVNICEIHIVNICEHIYIYIWNYMWNTSGIYVINITCCTA